MNRWISFLLAFLTSFSGSTYAVEINGQLKNAQLEKLSSDPVTNALEARVYHNTTAHRPKFYDGTSWIWFGQNSGTTRGDIPYCSATATPCVVTRLPLGIAGTVLHGSATDPSYSAVSLTVDVSGTLPAGNGGTGITSLGSGVATWLGTPSSSNLASAITDETGSGVAVFATSPSLTTPSLGVATATSINGSSIPSSKTLVVTTDKISVLASTSSSELAGVLSDESGTGLVAYTTSPAFTTPSLGAASATTINSTSIPSSKTLVVTTDKLSALASTTSSELAGVLSDESGTGVVAYTTSPSFTTPTLGAATATTINKVTLTQPGSGSTLTIADGKTLTVSNILTFTGTDSSSVAFGTGGTAAYTANKLSAFAATSSSELAGVLSDETGGSGVAVFNSSPAITSPTLTSPIVATSETYNAQAEVRFADSDSSNYVGFKSPATVAVNKIWTLPNADGGANQVLSTDGSLGLSWATVGTTTLNQYNVMVGNASNAETQVNTNLIGDVAATTSSQTYAVTSAAPGVFTVSGHGLLTGDKAYVTVTQNGFTANTTYYVSKIDANTFKLSTTLANAAIGTGITSSGTTAGTIVAGGFQMPLGVRGTSTNDSATAGYVGEVKEAIDSTYTNIVGGSNAWDDVIGAGPISLTPGDWLVGGVVQFSLSGAVCTAAQAGIGTASGNSSTGLTFGSTAFGDAPPTSAYDQSFVIPAFHVQITGSAVSYYLKAKGTFASGTPQIRGRITAWRIR